MKRHSLLALLVAGVFLIATAGLVLADESSWQSNEAGTEQMSNSDSSSSNYEGPVETGRTVESPSSASEWRENESSSPGHEPVEEFDGLQFREGIDTGP